MSIETFVTHQEGGLTLSGKPVKVRKLTLRDVFKIGSIVHRLAKKFGFEEAVQKAEITADDLKDVIQKVIVAVTSMVDLDDPDGKLSGDALLICGTLGSMIGVSAEDVIDSDLDDLYEAILKLWEVNKTGPLGQKIRHTIGAFAPTMQSLANRTAENFRRHSTEAVPSGGTPDGGTTQSSNPSSSDTDGPSDTSWTGYPPDVSLS